MMNTFIKFKIAFVPELPPNICLLLKLLSGKGILLKMTGSVKNCPSIPQSKWTAEKSLLRQNMRCFEVSSSSPQHHRKPQALSWAEQGEGHAEPGKLEMKVSFWLCPVTAGMASTAPNLSFLIEHIMPHQALPPQTPPIILATYRKVNGKSTVYQN